LTDVHWALKRSLGQGPLPSSFITYLFSLVGVDASSWANGVTASCFGAVCGLSVALETRATVARHTRGARTALS
jgi:hypothetical protein